MLKKILCLFLVVTLLTTTIDNARTSAFAPAIPLVAVGGFALVCAVMAVSLDVMGQNQASQDMNDLAYVAWLGASTAVKNSLQASYDAALAAGTGMMTLSTTVQNWLNSTILPLVGSNTLTGDVITTTSGMKLSYTQNSQLKFNSYAIIVPPAEKMILMSGVLTGATYQFQYDETDTGSGFYASDLFTGKSLSVTSQSKLYGYRTLTQTMVLDVWQHIFNNVHMTVITRGEFDLLMAKQTALQNSIPLSIPVPMPRDFIFTDPLHKDVDLVWNPDIGKYATPDGSRAYNPTDLADTDLKALPIPTIRERTDPITGDITKDLVVPVDGILTNVRTGEQIGTGETDIPGNPPLDWDQTPSDKINFEPLRLGPVFTRKFPFSIPWDIGRQFAILDVTPKTPVIKIDKSIPVFSTTMNMKFTIDFTMFDSIVVIVRWFLILAFDIGMIMSLRRFMPE